MFDVLAPAATETVSLNSAEFALTPNLGVMILSHDNRSKKESQLLDFKQQVATQGAAAANPGSPRPLDPYRLRRAPSS